MWPFWLLLVGSPVVASLAGPPPCHVFYGDEACDDRNPAMPVFHEIERRQSPPDCRAAQMLVNEAPWRQAGIGSRFSFYRACLARAVQQNRTYVDVACAASSDCLPEFVHPWTTCTADDVQAAKSEGRATVINGYDECFAFFQVSPKPQWPAMLWAAAATSFLLRPSAALRARLAHDLAHLPPYRMAMYIRHCDKGGEAVLQPMRAYVRALLGPGSGYPVARAPVYLVTDDADIYRHLQPDPGQSATPLHPPGDRTLLPYIFGNSSTRALRTCRWCNATVGASGAGACFRAHEERALLDLHLLAHAPVAASTFSSNYGQLLLFLQLFRHAFCAASLPVDSYFHALGHGWAYLRRAAPLSQGAGWVQLRQSVTLVRTAGAGRGDKDRTAAPLSAQEVAGMADDAVEAQDPWARAVHATCNVSTVADPAAGDATPAGCGHFRSVADRLWCHFRRHKARIVGRIWRGDRRGAGTSLPLELTAP